MSTDRIAYVNEKVPTKESLEPILSEFALLNNANLSWNVDRYFLSFPDVGMAQDDEDGERWIEVWLDNEIVDVITRLQPKEICSLANALFRSLLHQLNLSEEREESEDSGRTLPSGRDLV